MTNLNSEREEQQRWHLRAKWQNFDWFNQLVEREFWTPQQQLAEQSKQLRQTVHNALAKVPYYQQLFSRLTLGPKDIQEIEDLTKLPPLTKLDVQSQRDQLLAKEFRNSRARLQLVRSSGTTGRPTEVIHTEGSLISGHLISQRHMRWYRYDPMGTFAAIRQPKHLPANEQGEKIANGETYYGLKWANIGVYFETGTYLGYAVTNTIDEQLAWLRHQEPDYVLSYPDVFEHLAFALQDQPPPQGLRTLQTISRMLTPDMRDQIERSFKVPVRQSYGLNEMGIVASQCPESDRYHVHSERCLVEIVDDAGNACAPGETGKVLVTSHLNPAMPLIRYDTDDLAEAVESGSCVCGRTLPSFGRIIGRYSRTAHLPAGSLDYLAGVRAAFYAMPQSLIANLRQFQLHQFKDQTFELRLAAVAPLPNEFVQAINQQWAKVEPERETPRLTVKETDYIPRGAGDKFQEFTSDFTPTGTADVDRDPAPDG